MPQTLHMSNVFLLIYEYRVLNNCCAENFTSLFRNMYVVYVCRRHLIYLLEEITTNVMWKERQFLNNVYCNTTC